MNGGRTPLLEVRRLTKRFGGLTAVSELDFDVYPGEILGLIGPNGAGKSTTFALIAGAQSPTAGSVRFNGEPVAGLPPHEVAGRGILRTFQHNMPFASMSVTENVMVGMQCRFARQGLWPVLLATSGARAAERDALARAAELVEFVGLGEFRDAGVATLSFGQGRLLEIARALAGEPRLIMFDEPAAGLTPAECVRLAEIVRGIAARGIAVLLIEHDMHFLLRLAERVVVLNFGAKIADGAPEAISRDPAVVAAYLGDSIGVEAGGAAPSPPRASGGVDAQA